VGDRIKIGDVSGDVLEKTMLVIKLRTIKNEEITIPNSTILSSNTMNYSAFSEKAGLVLHTTVTIGYDVPWRTVHKLLIDAALATKGIMESPAPFVWQTALNDFHISYQLNIYTQEASKQGSIYADLHANIQDAFRDAGIEILSPGYMALRNGNDSTIPPTNKD
ncbi:MAG: mechanosensitive ion channel family protein, partial [Chitinophagaceae bacterium]|nr:mechanosensitive ion channel family protein [Chitinophagaceae bacterium]